jgi:hypothetical protein
MSNATLSVALLVVMVLGSACASTPKTTPARAAGAADTPAADLEQAERSTPGVAPSTDCEAQGRAHSSYLTQLALRHGVAGTLYLSFVGAAQGAFYGVIAGGGKGAGQGALIGAAAGAGLGLVLGSIEGWGRARDARAAYESAFASCRTAAAAPPIPPPAPAPPPAPTAEAPPAPEAAPAATLPD